MSCNLQNSLAKFHQLGINHKSTPLEIREKFYLIDSEREELLKEVKNHKDIESFVALSTCNRTEIYAYCNEPKKLEKLLLKFSKGTKKELQQFVYRLQGKEAVNHLFNISAGLDSQVIGDFQVAGQLKKAYKDSEKVKILNSFMIRLFSQVFQATKLIKNNTNLSKGAASIAHAAVQFIKEKKSNLNNSKFLLYGLGSIGKVACSNLMNNLQNKNLVLINRTKEKAENIAKKFDVTYKTQDKLADEVENAEIILVATGAKESTLLPAHFNGNHKGKIVLDLSVPRNVHGDVAKIKGVDLVCIDDLTNIQDKTLAKRRKSIPKAKRIIEENINEFYEWLELRHFSPIFQILQKKLLQLKNDELAYHKNKLTDAEFKKVDIISTNLLNRISRIAIKHIRQKAKNHTTALNTLNDFFKD